MQHLRSCLYKPRVFHGIKSLDGVIISNQQSFGNKQTINWDDTSGKKCFCYENKVLNRKNWQRTHQVLQLLIRYGTPPAGAWGKIRMGSDKEERESFGIAAFIDDTDGTGDLKLFFPANQMVCCFSCFFFFSPKLYVFGISWHTHEKIIIIKIKGTQHKIILHLELDSAKRRERVEEKGAHDER